VISGSFGGERKKESSAIFSTRGEKEGEILGDAVGCEGGARKCSASGWGKGGMFVSNTFGESRPGSVPQGEGERSGNPRSNHAGGGSLSLGRSASGGKRGGERWHLQLRGEGGSDDSFL